LFCHESDDPERSAFLEQVHAPVVVVRTKADRGGDGVSVVTGQGLAELRKRLAEVAFGQLLALGDVEPVVTRARHRAALERALAELDGFWEARQAGVDAAAAATHLRAAVTALDDLVGAVTPDDVLDRVFAAFCVGK
jgi:tRNA modification GTPase